MKKKTLKDKIFVLISIKKTNLNKKKTKTSMANQSKIPFFSKVFFVFQLFCCFNFAPNFLKFKNSEFYNYQIFKIIWTSKLLNWLNILNSKKKKKNQKFWNLTNLFKAI